MNIESKDQIKADLLFQVRRGKVRQMSGALAAQVMDLKNWVLVA